MVLCDQVTALVILSLFLSFSDILIDGYKVQHKVAQ